jgi:shikimate kinase
MNVVLIGFRGGGKTAAGRRAAARLGVRFLDTDELVEKAAGKSIAAIFKEEGEESFRRVEADVIRSLAGSDGCLIAVGGGAPCREETRKALEPLGRVVWLKASAQTVLRRIEGGGRPALTSLPPGEEVELLVRRRRDAYAALADFIVRTDDRTEEEVAHELERIWRDVQDHDLR